MSWSLLKQVHWVDDAIQPSHPLLSPSPPAFCLSQHHGLFQWIDSSYEVAKVLELQHQSFQWIFPLGLTGLISLLPKGLSSLFQHHNSKASSLWHSAFFMVQLSHPYMTTGKTIALTVWTFVSKVMSLLFNMLSKLFIAFLPRSKCLLILWLHSPSTVILEPKKIVCHCFPIYLPWSDGTGCHDLKFFAYWIISQPFTLLFHLYQKSYFLFTFCH